MKEEIFCFHSVCSNIKVKVKIIISAVLSPNLNPVFSTSCGSSSFIVQTPAEPVLPLTILSGRLGPCTTRGPIRKKVVLLISGLWASYDNEELSFCGRKMKAAENGHFLLVQ